MGRVQGWWDGQIGKIDAIAGSSSRSGFILIGKGIDGQFWAQTVSKIWKTGGTDHQFTARSPHYLVTVAGGIRLRHERGFMGTFDS